MEVSTSNDIIVKEFSPASHQKELDPADWGATCMLSNQQDHVDKGDHTDCLGIILQAQPPLANLNACCKYTSKLQTYG